MSIHAWTVQPHPKAEKHAQHCICLFLLLLLQSNIVLPPNRIVQKLHLKQTTVWIRKDCCQHWLHFPQTQRTTTSCCLFSLQMFFFTVFLLLMFLINASEFGHINVTPFAVHFDMHMHMQLNLIFWFANAILCCHLTERTLSLPSLEKLSFWHICFPNLNITGLQFWIVKDWTVTNSRINARQNFVCSKFHHSWKFLNIKATLCIFMDLKFTLCTTLKATGLLSCL